MRFLPLFLLFSIFSATSAFSQVQLQTEIAEQSKAARKILDAWHAENPRESERTLHLVYWTPKDREPAPQYQQRLTRIFEDIQKFYAAEMDRIGFGPRSIDLDIGDDKLIQVPVVRGLKDYSHYNVQSGSEIRRECLPTLRKAGIDPDRETIVIFCNMGDWDEEKKSIRHRSPYYAGGNAGHGTAWQLDSPILDTKNLPLKEPMIRDGQYGRISIGKHNSIFIGGVAHELGHALGLPHNRERPDERKAFGTALMGSGNRTYGDQLRGEGRGSFLTLAHAMRLASHPQFSGSIKGLYVPTRASFDEFSVATKEDSFVFDGRVRSMMPVYAVVAYLDPAGGSDYDAPTATAVPDREGRFSLDCAALAKGKTAELKIVACHVNGATSTQRFQYSVDAQGKPDLSALQIKFELAPVIAALGGGKRAEAKAARDKIELPLAREIASGLIDPRDQLGEPAELPAGTKEIALSDTSASTSKVGWMRPAYNRIPGKAMLLEAGGRVFDKGIYAHAPARHVYSLGRRWKRLNGECGLGAGSRGSVVFVIKVDGKERWRSKTVKGGAIHKYSVDVSGAGKVELLVEDAGDGNGADWGLWLNPQLKR